MAKKFSKADKKLITHILKRGLELVESNELTDFYDLGLLASHLEFIAASSESKTEDRHEDYTYGANGDVVYPDLVDKIQDGCDLLPRFEKSIPDKKKWWFTHVFGHRYETEAAIPKLDFKSLLDGIVAN